MIVVENLLNELAQPIATGAEITSSELITGSGVGPTFLQSSSTLEISIAVNTPTPNANNLTIPIPPEIDVPTIVIIGGIPYDFVIEGDQIFVVVPDNIILPPTIVITGLPATFAPESPVSTNEVLHGFPDWVTQWNLSGTLTIDRKFGDQPSGNFTFYALASNESAIRTAFRPLTKLRFDPLNMGFTVGTGVQITRLPKTIYPDGWIEVSVPLSGYWVRELSTRIKLKADSCEFTAQALSRRANLPILGGQITMNLSRSVSEDVTTTMADELAARAITIQGFPFYSSDEAVQVRTWGTTTNHQIPSTAIRSAFPITVNGTGVIYSGTRLTSELYDAPVQLEADQELADRQKEAEYWLEEGDPLLETAPSNIPSDGLKTPALNANNGGPTKRRIRTLYRNGAIQKKITLVYGLVYKSTWVYERVYRVIGNPTVSEWRFRNDVSPNSFWQIVDDSTETYVYDDLGYLIQVKKIGKKLLQFRQEQNNEALTAALTSTISINGVVLQDGEKLRRLYDFFWLPYSDITTFELNSYVGLYPDVFPSDSADWIEPKYAAVIDRRSFDKVETTNPESDQQSQTLLPAVTCGRVFQERQAVRIVYPTPQTLRKAYEPQYDRYKKTHLTQNAEGADLKDSLRIGNEEETDGRPPIHTRMQLLTELECAPRAEVEEPDPIDYVYLLNTPNSSTSINASDASISFPGVTTAAKARECAETQISIQNTFEAEATAFELDYSIARLVEEGDRFVAQGTQWVCDQVSFAYTFGQGTATVTCQISGGKYLRPPVSLTRKRVEPRS